MSDPPLIGITTSEVRRADRTSPTAQADPQRTELALGLKYPEAVERAGGVPVILPDSGAEDPAPIFIHVDEQGPSGRSYRRRRSAFPRSSG